MAAHSFDSLLSSAQKGDFAPVTYLTGDEDTLKEELLSTCIENALEEGTRDFNLDIRSAGDLNPESIIALVDTPPMMAERRVVVIKSLEQWRKNSKQWNTIRKYAENPSASTLLFLLHRLKTSKRDEPDRVLVAHSRHGDIGSLAPQRVGAWIEQQAEKIGVEITEDAREHLARVVGPDLAKLKTEITKLAAAAGEEPVTEKDVEVMVGVNHGETVADWIATVIDRDTPRAIELLDVVLAQAGVSGVRLVSNLGTALIGVRFARAVLDDGESARKTQERVMGLIKNTRPWGIGSWSKEAARWTSAAGRWGALQLDNALRAAFDADRNLKSTTITGERGILVQMLLEMGTAMEES